MSMYFENDSTIKSNKQKTKINYEDLTLNLYTDNGVFSKEKLDYGTKLLLKTLSTEKMHGKILDLGCGYGAIGIYLAIKTSCQIDMVDINERAIKLSEENIHLNNLSNIKVFISNIYENINTTYNYIITNPPIRAGKETIRNFLLNAKDYLEENGELWFVMRKDHGVKSIIKELEKIYIPQIITKDKGFYIVMCQKK